MKPFRVALLAIPLAALGCPKHYTPNYAVPAPFVHTYAGPSPEEPAARITVLRGSELTGAAVYFGIMLDSIVISSLLTAEYTEFDLSPGEHKIGVTCYAWYKWRGNELVINVEADSVLYFVLRAKGTECEIARLDPSSRELSKLQEGSLLVPVGKEGPP